MDHTATMTRRARAGVRHPLREDTGQQTAAHLSALIAVSVNEPAKTLADVTVKYACSKRPHTNRHTNTQTHTETERERDREGGGSESA